ncbi:MAG: hypothetical protein MSH21_07940 [Clostridium sp.]|nr:hypothetical protein [Clostridium sp.]
MGKQLLTNIKENKKVVIILSLVCLIIALFYSCQVMEEKEREEQYEAFIVEMDKKYDEAINIIANNKSGYYSDEEIKELNQKLAPYGNTDTFMEREIKYFGKEKVYSVINRHSYGRMLYHYAYAIHIYNGDPMIRNVYRTNAAQYKAAFDEINKIPDKYNGDFAEKIKEEKKHLKSAYEEAAGLLKAVQEDEKKTLHIGDSELKIEQIYGKPIKVNISQNAYSEHKQYVYNNMFIYVDDGVVTSYQTR